MGFTDHITGTRFSRSISAIPGKHIIYQLTPPQAPSSYYTKVVISDAIVQDLQLRIKISNDCGEVTEFTFRSNLAENPQELKFPDHLKVRTGEISFTVTRVTSYGNAVINVHKHSTSLYNHYL